MNLSEIKKNNLVHEFYFFKLVFLASGILVYTFYFILLYKATQSITALIINEILFYTFLWAGFIVGNIVIEKFGYVKTLKISFVWQGLIAIFVAFNLQNIATIYPIFAIFASFPRGMFWAVNHMYLLKEFQNKQRSIIITTINAINNIFSIVLPFLIGATITFTGDYFWIFIMGGAIVLVGCLFPWKYNKKPEAKITSREIIQILSHRKFKLYAIVNSIFSGFENNMAMIFTVTAFLFLKSESKVGLLASLMNFVGAIILFIEKERHFDHEVKLGIIGAFINSFFNLIFAVFWSFPALIVRSVFVILGLSIRDPVIEKTDYIVREDLLGNDKVRSAEEMNIIIETISFFGRVVVLVFIYILLNIIQVNQPTATFQIIVFIYSVVSFIYFMVLLKLKSHYPKEQEHHSPKMHNIRLFGTHK